MTKRRNQPVVSRDGGWAAKPEGGQRASSIHGTQREAIDRGREVFPQPVRSSSSTDGTAESASGTATATTPIRRRAEALRARTVQAPANIGE
ncbi:MAG TPA: DUF2188 domain-containing protein [Stellaceae bacterium]|nr:DUF2188 domain-containing protein [Stellaceae bacterium]